MIGLADPLHDRIVELPHDLYFTCMGVHMSLQVLDLLKPPATHGTHVRLFPKYKRP